jgi:cysteine synthase A
MSATPNELVPKVAHNFVELIGNTPLMEFDAYEKEESLPAHVIGKLEYFNPAGSVKDRVGYALIAAAEREGKIKPGDTIIEPTSGNTGVGLAACGAALGYRVIIVMPETMSVERRKIIRQYGAELVLTPGSEGMKGSIAKAEELNKQTPNSFIPQQFENPANPAIHRATTAEEIWRDMAGQVDAVVGGVGTGGTISGIAQALRKRDANIKFFAVQPTESPVLTGGASGKHGIQGIMPGFKAKNFDDTVIDEIIDVSTEQSIAEAQKLARAEGILVGISSGAALAAAAIIAKRPEFKGKNIIAILPDTGERYLSTALFPNGD